MLQLTGARLIGWFVVLSAFVGVWLSARQLWILFVTVLGLMPVQLFACRAILVERRYPAWFAWFSLLFGPMGVLVVLGLPVLPEGPSP